MTGSTAPSDGYRADARVVWEFHLVRHELRACSVGIGLGSHDIGVARFAAELFHQGLFPTLLFTGATSPGTADVFPRGEAIHYAEEARALGVPDDAIIIEPRARNTGQNIDYSRAALRGAGITTDSVLLISKPYMQRRAYATTRKRWPEVQPVCASEPLTFDEYAAAMGDETLVINMLVGDLQRVIEYPALGFAIAQHVPDDVHAAYRRLRDSGFDSRLL